MYISTNKFPHFKGKNKKYTQECIKYVFKKEPKLTRGFVYAILAVVAFSVVSTICVAMLPLPRFIVENEGIIGSTIVGVSFYIFLLVHINIYIYPAVEKYIAEFDSIHKND